MTRKHKLFWQRGQTRDLRRETAVVVDGEAAFERTVKRRQRHSDPVLLWLVEIRCTGSRLPTDPDDARSWLRDHADAIRDGLTRLARRIAAAQTPDEWPLLESFPGAPRGVHIDYYVSAIRPMTLANLVAEVEEIRDNWEEILCTLEPAREAQERG